MYTMHKQFFFDNLQALLVKPNSKFTVERDEQMKIFQINTFNGSQKLFTIVLASLLATTTLAACTNPFTSNSSQANNGIHKIKHVVVIMQENRSFDTYFGTYPGANGIPMQNGVPTVCVHDPN